MVMKKLEEIKKNIFYEKWAILKFRIPQFKKLFHFIAKAQRVVCFYQARENEKDTHNNPNDI